MKQANPVRPLRTVEDYEAALVDYEAYFDNEPELGSPDGDRFELLGLVLAKYEGEQFPIEEPTAVEALRFSMEQSGRTQKDLGELLGSRSRASEILKGKRDLSLDQIRKLHLEWRIPASVLIGTRRAA